MKTADQNVTKWRTHHHNALARLFNQPLASGYAIWRKLRRIEAQVQSVIIDYTNGENGVGFEQMKTAEAKARKQITALGIREAFFINSDPRGYALKIQPQIAANYQGIHTDWGGYGCLAAEIN